MNKPHNAPVITPELIKESWRQATITAPTADQISGRLGFEPNGNDDGDKVVNCWEFTVDGVPCSVWDYRGSHTMVPPRHSAFGPIEALIAVFGHNHVTQ